MGDHTVIHHLIGDTVCDHTDGDHVADDNALYTITLYGY